MFHLLSSPHFHSYFRTFPPFIAIMCISNLIQIHTTLTIQDTNNPRLTYSSRELRKLADSMQHDNKYLVLNPGAIGNIHRFETNRTKISTSKRQVKEPRGVNTSNLKHIRTVAFSDKDPRPNIRIDTANARSVRNKDQLLSKSSPTMT